MYSYVMPHTLDICIDIHERENMLLLIYIKYHINVQIRKREKNGIYVFMRKTDDSWVDESWPL